MEEDQEIKNLIRELFEKISSDIRVEFESAGEKSFRVCVRMKEPQMLIGERGQTLVETEKLLKIIVRKKAKGPVFINLDINDYRKRKADYLQDIAMEAADDVALTGVERKFPPMSSFERRVVHVALSKREDVVTESYGMGSERFVAIKRKRDF